MNTKEKIKQMFKKCKPACFLGFSRSSGCPDCGDKELLVRPSHPGCTDMVSVYCLECHLGWGEAVEEFLSSNPESHN